MKRQNYLLEALFIARTKNKGRGVFTNTALKKNLIIEIAPVIVMPQKDRVYLDKTLMHDYIFEWGSHQDQCCMALGYVPLYNHSYNSNCEYQMDFKNEIISVITVRPIRPGEELLINYNGDANSKKKLWFDIQS